MSSKCNWGGGPYGGLCFILFCFVFTTGERSVLKRKNKTRLQRATSFSLPRLEAQNTGGALRSHHLWEQRAQEFAKTGSRKR